MLRLTSSHVSSSIKQLFKVNQGAFSSIPIPKIPSNLPSVHELELNVLKDTSEVDDGLKRMLEAQEIFSHYTQEKVDEIFEYVSKNIRKNCFELGRYAVEESGIGLAEDKVLKNLYAAEYCYTKNKDLKTCGIIEQDDIDGVYKVAEPVGPICALVPCTNPTSTVIMKALSALKTRNTIMFLPHPRTKLCSSWAANLMEKYAVEAGAPPNSIMTVMPSREMSEHVMKHHDIRFVLATGGPAMVAACYAAGKPAIGVGPGNCPVLIDENYSMREAINSIVIGKTFDWGTICASENSVIVMQHQYEEAKQCLADRGVYLLTPEDKEKLQKIFMPDGHNINPDIVGKSPHHIAGMAGIEIPSNTVALCVEESGIGDEYPFSHEKLSPIFALYTAENFEQGTDIARRLAEHGGLGHTSAIYSKNNDHVHYYADKLPTYHVAINMPTSLGVIGIKYNVGVDPTLTVGVGSIGGSIASANVGPSQLIQVKVVNEKRNIPEVFRTPDIYSNKFCLRSALQNILAQTKCRKALIVTASDKAIKPVLDELSNLDIYAEIFSYAENKSPSAENVDHGVQAITDLNPDIIIAVGDRNVLHLAKLMRLKQENQKDSLHDLAAPFLESRWRNTTVNSGKRSNFLVAIPTLFSMGTEMTPFAFFRDSEKIYSVVLDGLLPDIVVQDPQFITSSPDKRLPRMAFYSSLRAIESYVSVNATRRTRLLAKEAIQDLLSKIPDLANSDLLLNEKTSKSVGDIGIAMGNTCLGLATGMSMAFSAKFGVGEQISLALFLPHIINYNSKRIPTRSTPTPNVPYPQAAELYAELAFHMGINGSNEEELIQGLMDVIKERKQELGLPVSVKDIESISEEEYMAAVPQLAIDSFGNQLAAGNPRMGLVKELEDLFRAAYGSRE